MRRHQSTPSSSSPNNSDGSDIESCFDTEDEQEETDADTDVEDTDPIDINTNSEEYDQADLANLADLVWIAGEDNAHPPEHYLDQENDSDESEDEDEA